MFANINSILIVFYECNEIGWIFLFLGAWRILLLAYRIVPIPIVMAPSAKHHRKQASKSKIKNFKLLKPATPNMAGIMLRMAGKNLPTKIT